MNFDFKSLLNFDKIYGRKLVTIVYYIMAGVIAINVFVSFVSGIVNVADGMIFEGIEKIVFCLPLAVVYLFVLRLVCELISTIFEHCGK